MTTTIIYRPRRGGYRTGSAVNVFERFSIVRNEDKAYVTVIYDLITMVTVSCH